MPEALFDVPYIYYFINPHNSPSRKVSMMAQMVNNLPAMQGTWVRSLGREDPLEEGRATHSSILAWRLPWTEEPGGATAHGVQRVGRD